MLNEVIVEKNDRESDPVYTTLSDGVEPGRLVIEEELEI